MVSGVCHILCALLVAQASDHTPKHVAHGRAELLARSKYSDYEKATFSFKHGIRDDADRSITRNNWDVQYGNGQHDLLSVRMVTDDRSVIVDLGSVALEDLHTIDLSHYAIATRARASVGHAYLVITFDSDAHLAALFRVTHLVPNDRCTIEWFAIGVPQTNTNRSLSLLTAQEGSP